MFGVKIPRILGGSEMTPIVRIRGVSYWEHPIPLDSQSLSR